MRAKSLALTAFTVRLADDLLAPLGVSVASPRDAAERGGHVTLQHPDMKTVTARLWQQDVIPDYRDPGGLRIGLSPLSTSFAETLDGLLAVRDAVGAETLGNRRGNRAARRDALRRSRRRRASADDVHRPNRLSAGTIYRLRRTDIDRLS